MALSGTLKDFGIADIFQLIGQQQKTGVLHLSEREEQVHVAFKDGSIIRAECTARRRKELLGDMLVRAALITERQLEDALQEQKRTLKKVGDILVAHGALDRAALREMAQLQTSETIYRLFSWKNGTYAFEAADVESDPDLAISIRSETVLMEGFRRVDEWPAVRKRINNPAMTFERLRSLPAPAPTEDVDVAFDAAFEGAPSGPTEAVGTHERRIFKLADPGRDVTSIVDRSRIGEFEACKALLNLVNGGYLRPVAPRPDPAETEAGDRRVLDRALRWAGKLAAAVALLAVLGVMAAYAPASPIAVQAANERPAADAALRRLASRAQMARLELALSAYVLDTGRSPDSLAALIEAGILSKSDVRYPWTEPYFYRKTGEATWVLLPPLR